MEEEVKIIELELDGMTLKPTDIRMGGVIETKQGTSYIVLIIGARFEFNESGPVLLPDPSFAVVGEQTDTEDEDDPVFGIFYNLKLVPFDEKEEAPMLFSEKGKGKSYETPKGTKAVDFASRHSELPIGTPDIEAQPRRELQHLLFSIHAHYDPDHEGNTHPIIYFETDLAKVCGMTIESLESSKKEDTSPETLAFINGQLDVLNQMKAFFEHKA